MLVDFRPTGKLRGSKPVDVTAALGPVVDALAEDSVDLSRVRVVCDWVQYRSNFRDVVDIRPILVLGDPFHQHAALGCRNEKRPKTALPGGTFEPLPDGDRQNRKRVAKGRNPSKSVRFEVSLS